MSEGGREGGREFAVLGPMQRTVDLIIMCISMYIFIEYCYCSYDGCRAQFFQNFLDLLFKLFRQ